MASTVLSRDKSRLLVQVQNEVNFSIDQTRRLPARFKLLRDVSLCLEGEGGHRSVIHIVNVLSLNPDLQKEIAQAEVENWRQIERVLRGV